MTTPTLLISFASLVLGGVAFTNDTPIWKVPAEGKAMVASVSAVVPGFGGETEEKPANVIFLASHDQALPQGVTRLP